MPCALQITGGMLNGVSPNYRDMAPALRAITSVSYNRHAASIVHSACTALLVLPWLASSVVQSLAPAPAAPLADACIAGWLAGMPLGPGCCRWAIEVVTIQQYANFPQWRWPATKAAMSAAGKPTPAVRTTGLPVGLPIAACCLLSYEPFILS